jgi:segregation and condensation protein B
MEMETKLAALEALLFVHGEPMPLKKIAAVIGVSIEEMPELVAEFKRALDEGGRGLALVGDQSSIQLVTKPALAPVIQEFVKRELTEDLTPASLEALSLVAYLGPLPRARLDYLRGVNSSFILRNLMMRGLVERYPDPEHPSIVLYRATIDLWKHLGVEDQARLPEYEKFKTLAEAPVGEEAAAPSVAPLPAAEVADTADASGDSGAITAESGSDSDAAL